MKHGLTLEQRFWHYVNKAGPNDCWEWQGSIDTPGYGIIRDTNHKKHLRAHRLAYQIHKGEIPVGMCVCHSCDNKKCVNPIHLWIGTHQDNTVDCKNKGRLDIHPQKGTKHGMSKLTDKQVMEIRSSIKSKYELARIYGIHYSVICKILRWANWTHLPRAA